MRNHRLVLLRRAEQLDVRAARNDAAVIEQKDLVRHADRAHAVRDRNDGARA